jgi:hypothetical protein
LPEEQGDKRVEFRLVLAITALILFSTSWKSSEARAATPPDRDAIQMTVTAESTHGYDVPAITRADVMVYQGHARAKVTDWIPARGDRAGLELFMLIDDSANSTLGVQLDDIRQFINSQSASAKVGVAYMQNGVAQIVQNLTSDHEQAAKAVRLPLGAPGIDASPYFSLDDLIKRWPESNSRREVVIVSDGIDRFWGSGPDDPYISSVIEKALRAGVLVYAIYTPGVGHYGRNFWRSWWGQIYLSRVADETGGESYSIGFYGPPVSFAPYLSEITRRLDHQYLLTIEAQPEKKAGMERMKITTEVPNVELVSANSISVLAQP